MAVRHCAAPCYRGTGVRCCTDSFATQFVAGAAGAVFYWPCVAFMAYLLVADAIDGVAVVAFLHYYHGGFPIVMIVDSDNVTVCQRGCCA